MAKVVIDTGNLSELEVQALVKHANIAKNNGFDTVSTIWVNSRIQDILHNFRENHRDIEKIYFKSS